MVFRLLFSCARKGANSSKKTAQPVEIAPNPPIKDGWRRRIHYASPLAAMQHTLSDLKSWN
jgi:hypothetical protein